MSVPRLAALTLAGNISTINIIRPHAAQNLVGSNRRPSAPASSATPVTDTKRSGRGSPGGTMATRSFFIGVKCEIAVNRNIVANATRALASHVENVITPASPSSLKKSSEANRTSKTCIRLSRRWATTVDPRAVIVQAEQRDHAGDVCFVANANEIADPSGFRIHVMRLGATCRDELLADEQWKREIRQPVAVQMSQLAPSEPKLNSAKSVRAGRHARPCRYLTRERLLVALRPRTKSPPPRPDGRRRPASALGAGRCSPLVQRPCRRKQAAALAAQPRS